MLASACGASKYSIAHLDYFKRGFRRRCGGRLNDSNVSPVWPWGMALGTPNAGFVSRHESGLQTKLVGRYELPGSRCGSCLRAEGVRYTQMSAKS
jgi:hypothetical protein